MVNATKRAGVAEVAANEEGAAAEMFVDGVLDAIVVVQVL
jgi:hypothetical protein